MDPDSAIRIHILKQSLADPTQEDNGTHLVNQEPTTAQAAWGLVNQQSPGLVNMTS